MQHVGCDFRIKSNAVEDRCGVCHGDGRSCEMVIDKFTKESGIGKLTKRIDKYFRDIFEVILRKCVCVCFFFLMVCKADLNLTFYVALTQRINDTDVFRAW